MDFVVRPAAHPLRYSARREAAQRRRERIAETLTVHPDFFAGKRRG